MFTVFVYDEYTLKNVRIENVEFDKFQSRHVKISYIENVAGEIFFFFFLQNS